MRLESDVRAHQPRGCQLGFWVTCSDVGLIFLGVRDFSLLAAANFFSREKFSIKLFSQNNLGKQLSHSDPGVPALVSQEHYRS